MEKDFHSDTYVVDPGAEHNKTDELISDESDLQNRVYSHNKNKRASLYSDFGDVDLNFVVDEDLYFADKDEDISFESDTESNDDDGANYKEFLQEEDREKEDEIFDELIAEVGLVSVPTRAAPTVGYESLGSIEHDDLDHDDDDDLSQDEEEDQDQSDILKSLQEVKIPGEVTKLVLRPATTPELLNCAANIHETTILNDESKIRETVKTGAAGEASPEYEECSEIRSSEQNKSLTEQNPASQSDYYSQADSFAIVEECLEEPDARSDIKEESIFMNAKDDHGATEIISHAKSVTDLESGDHAQPSALDINSQETKDTEQLSIDTHEQSNNTLDSKSVLANTEESSELNIHVTSSSLENADSSLGDGLIANQLVEETGLAEEKENELIVKSSHGSDYSDESLSNPVSALVLAGPVSSQV